MEEKGSSRVVVWTLCIWLSGHLILIAGHVLLVFLYSVTVAPGLEHAAYQAFAERTAVGYSILVGGPVFFGLGRLLRRRMPLRARGIGFAAWALYTLTDAAVLVVVGVALTPLFAGQWVLSQAVKGLAMHLGTRNRER